MLTRRNFLLSSFASMTLLALPAHRAAAAGTTPEQAKALIDRTARELIAVIDAGAPPKQMRAQLQQIVDRDVAVDAVGRFCLGRHWRVATAAQQQQYLQLFHRVLLNAVAGHLGEYKGVTYSIGRPTPGDGGIQVPSVINRPGQPPINLTWLVGSDEGSPKIIDLIAEGTSLRLTQRSDYNSYLNRNGGNIQTLLDALRRQASQSG